MSTQKDSLSADCSDLPDLSRVNVVVGAKQLRKALNKGRVHRVYLAKNADPAITEPLEVLCQSQEIPCVWIKSMSELGHACGIEVGATTAAVVD